VASRPQGPVRASCAAARLVRTVCGAAVRRRIRGQGSRAGPRAGQALFRCSPGSTAARMRASSSVPPRNAFTVGTTPEGSETSCAYGTRRTLKLGRAASHCSTVFSCCS